MELATGPGRLRADRRRRCVQRHLHVHLLQQDARAVADRQRPAVRRRRRRHRPRRGAGHGRAEAPRRRPPRRRPHLRRAARHRHVERRQGQRDLRPARRRARSTRCATPTPSPASAPRRSNSSRRTAPARASATPPRSAPWPRSTARRAGAGPWCAVGSVKSQIGHTKAAAGVAGLLKAAAALANKVLPPTIKVTKPLDVLQQPDGPLYVNTEKRPWMPSADHPRRAAVSAFGFGGSNFHAVLEEARPGQDARSTGPATSRSWPWPAPTWADVREAARRRARRRSAGTSCARSRAGRAASWRGGGVPAAARR